MKLSAILLVSSLAALSAGPALAYSERQEGVMTGIVAALAGSQLCANGTLNYRLAAEILLLTGLDHAQAISDVLDRAQAVIRAARVPPSRFACSVILADYGPEGRTVRNLIIPR